MAGNGTTRIFAGAGSGEGNSAGKHKGGLFRRSAGDENAPSLTVRPHANEPSAPSQRDRPSGTTATRRQSNFNRSNPSRLTGSSANVARCTRACDATNSSRCMERIRSPLSSG